jgi:hypothetical protein
VEVLFVGLPGGKRLSRLFPPHAPACLLRAAVDVAMADAAAQEAATAQAAQAEVGEEETAGHATTDYELVAGFPPRPLLCLGRHATLADLGLRGRETIRVAWN